MLAYLFWHRPRESSEVESYEQAQLAFHRSLARSRPVGMYGSAVFRVAEIPWLAADERSGAPGYEDWYLLEDHTALGVLGEAAVGHGHRTAHDDLARRYGAGAGGLYGLVEGERCASGAHAELLGEASLAIWVARPLGAERSPLAELLGDGMDPAHASLWRRQFVFGPAPEFCLLARESTAGVADTRLPAGWTATSLEREALWHG
jgi:hypothetical protein